MKIYTRTGDRGTTGLFGGDRVSKHHPRIDAYGTVDETNSVLGVARAAMRDMAGVSLLDEMLVRVQGTLFALGADLATPPESRARTTRLGDAEVEWMEQSIDRLEADLPELRHFILPGGSPAGAQLHVARTVGRRAERLVTHLSEQEEINPTTLIYLNRLSDFLFVAARWVNNQAGAPETIWSGTS